ncbi:MULTISPECIES: EamA family transporter [Nguyenibacter]|uniref:EamA family transporter n=1 Tax=Nguyenibacter vanlangensis TaxID=1216886 RepID=A0ABZ3D2R4_9PROT|nr:EamA family transporter [Nguyenibacter sp. L1]WRH86978.1 EamA family transporter [Nguyenibacter sp. L1]
MKSDAPLLSGLLNGLAAGACWGTIFLAPELVPDFGALALSLARYLAYGLLSAALLAPRWRTVLPRVPASGWCGLFGLGLAGNLAYYVLIASAVRLCGIGATSIVTGFLPVTVALLGTRDAGSLPLRRLAPSLLLAAIGIGLIGLQAAGTPAASAAGAAPHRVLGLLCALAGLTSWSLFAVSNARWMRRLPTIGAGDWGLLTGLVTGAQSLVLLPVLALAGPGMAFGSAFGTVFGTAPGAGPATHDARQWLVFGAVSVGVGLLGSVLGGMFWNRASRQLPLTLSGQMAVGETLFALFYGCLWHQRWPTALEIAAVGFLAASVVTCAARHARPPAPRAA